MRVIWQRLLRTRAVNGSDGPQSCIVVLLPLYWVSQHAVAAGAAGGVPLAVSYRTPEAVAETQREYTKRVTHQSKVVYSLVKE